MNAIGENIVTHKIRYDFEIIASLVKPESKVIDIGCGNGDLLYFLKKNKKADCRGLEISQEMISNCLSKGLSVIHGDANFDLNIYPNDSFDYAVLGQTIQAMNNPKKIVQEMLRIAKYAIVSLPNFANYKNRFHLMFKGTMPVNKTIPFQWYETPNIHFCSIRDFENLCEDSSLIIKNKIFLTAKHQLISIFGNQIIANLFADYGIFLITKKEICATGQEQYSNTQMVFKKLNQLGLASKPISEKINLK